MVLRFKPVQLSVREQCLCCKTILSPSAAAYETVRSGPPNYLCGNCHIEQAKTPEVPMYRLPRYQEAGRVPPRTLRASLN